MLTLDKINPLNVLNIREVNDPPCYFEYVILDTRTSIALLLRGWIYENLKHRFYIGETLVIDNGNFIIKLKIGFEEPREASFFLLACSHLKEFKF
jgi:hypothetical protein